MQDFLQESSGLGECSSSSQMGCCPIHKSFNKANQICYIKKKNTGLLKKKRSQCHKTEGRLKRHNNQNAMCEYCLGLKRKGKNAKCIFFFLEQLRKCEHGLGTAYCWRIANFLRYDNIIMAVRIIPVLGGCMLQYLRIKCHDVCTHFQMSQKNKRRSSSKGGKMLSM